MSQKLVTKKNKKIKQLREQYPHIKCKIFYQRDYLHLLIKYGLEEPESDLVSLTPRRVPGPPKVLDLVIGVGV